MKKREVSQLRFMLVGAITLLIFLFGLLLGNYLTTKKLDQVSVLEENFRLQTAAAELQYLLLIEEPCVNDTDPLLNDLYEISKRVEFMEEQRGPTDLGVLRVKNEYSILQIRHYLYTLRVRERCEQDRVPVLYFYSNQGDCPECREQGYALNYLRRKYPDLHVYAFDISLHNSAIDTLKEVHGVTDAPALVLPDDRRGFTTTAQLEAVLTTEHNLTAQP